MTENPNQRKVSRSANFRGFVLRGLGVVLPPLLTIVVLIWAWNTIESYVLRPMESVVRTGLVLYAEHTEGTIEGVPDDAEEQKDGSYLYESYLYKADPTGKRYIPAYVKSTVDDNADYFSADAPPLVSANAYWHRYIEVHWMPRRIVVPVFLIVFLTVLYFLGRLFTFGLGRWFFRGFDSAILRIPIVNKVYGSVKQVTDFAFNEREIEFNNVVAVQYPSKGIWSIGFVTGESLREISEATGEPMLSVLMPTSPMPMTGFTVTVKRSDTIDLDMTVDEAIQFVVSCGVVVPVGQRTTRSLDAHGKPLVLPTTDAINRTNDPSTV